MKNTVLVVSEYCKRTRTERGFLSVCTDLNNAKLIIKDHIEIKELDDPRVKVLKEDERRRVDIVDSFNETFPIYAVEYVRVNALTGEEYPVILAVHERELNKYLF